MIKINETHFTRSLQNGFFSFSTSVLCMSFMGCEGKKTPTETPRSDLAACAPEQFSELTNPTNLFFTAGLGLSAGPESSTVVYRLTFPELNLTPVLVRDSSSNDPLLYRSKDADALYLIERFSGQALSRMTKLSNAGSKVEAELAGLPMNLSGLLQLASGHLLTVGWDHAETAVVKGDLSAFVKSTSSLTGLREASKEADSHLETLLSENDKTYALSTGYSLSSLPKMQATQAKLHLLNSTFDSVTESFDIPDCQNAYSWFYSQRSATHLVAGCNPQYMGPSAEMLALVDIQLKDGKPLFRTLQKESAQRTQQWEVGGWNAAGTEIFVSEKTTHPEITSGLIEKIAHSYILNLQDLSKKELKSLAGKVHYVPALKSYVFSCVRDSESQKCLPKTFGVLAENQLSQPEKACSMALTYKHDFLSFERNMP
jgi:hypothetical protein